MGQLKSFYANLPESTSSCLFLALSQNYIDIPGSFLSSLGWKQIWVEFERFCDIKKQTSHLDLSNETVLFWLNSDPPQIFHYLDNGKLTNVNNKGPKHVDSTVSTPANNWRNVGSQIYWWMFSYGRSDKPSQPGALWFTSICSRSLLRWMLEIIV